MQNNSLTVPIITLMILAGSVQIFSTAQTGCKPKVKLTKNCYCTDEGKRDCVSITPSPQMTPQAGTKSGWNKHDPRDLLKKEALEKRLDREAASPQ